MCFVQRTGLSPTAFAGAKPRLPLFRKGSGKQNIESGKNSDTTDHLVFRLESHCVRLFGEGVQKGRSGVGRRVGALYDDADEL